jgi:hypothetical protein
MQDARSDGGKPDSGQPEPEFPDRKDAPPEYEPPAPPEPADVPTELPPPVTPDHTPPQPSA